MESETGASGRRYRRLGQVGHGAFAVVYRGEVVGGAGGAVALKRLRGSAGVPFRGADVDWPAVREVAVMRALGAHPSVLELLDVVVDARGRRLTLVLPLCLWDLDSVIVRPATRLSGADAKRYATGVLAALAHCAARGVLHRDVKPNNVLVAADGAVKLGDWGSARIVRGEDGARSAQAVSRWYRAPELMFGERAYGPAVDAWAAGCVIAEIVRRDTLWQGDSDIDQLVRIFTARGAPSPESWPAASALPFFMPFRLPAVPPGPDGARGALRRALTDSALGARPREECPVDDALLDLVDGLLALDPARRLTAAAAAEHPWFDSLPLPTRRGGLPAPHGDSVFGDEQGRPPSSGDEGDQGAFGINDDDQDSWGSAPSDDAEINDGQQHRLQQGQQPQGQQPQGQQQVKQQQQEDDGQDGEEQQHDGQPDGAPAPRGLTPAPLLPVRALPNQRLPPRAVARPGALQPRKLDLQDIDRR